MFNVNPTKIPWILNWNHQKQIQSNGKPHNNKLQPPSETKESQQQATQYEVLRKKR